MSVIIQKQATINAPQTTVFGVIYNVQEYSDFIPWCKKADYLGQAHSHNAQAQKVQDAYMTLAIGPFNYTLTTRNSSCHPHSIELVLISGPVKHLTGIWSLNAVDEATCSAQLDMTFAWKNIVLQKSLGALFHGMCCELVDRFKQRAESIHEHNLL